MTNPQSPADQLTSQTTFAELGVCDDIVRGLGEEGITNPFPIQELSIPIALTGADLIGQARTGTGKTLAFGIPALQHILLEGDEDFPDLKHPGKPQVLIMLPTRELALQVTQDLSAAAKYRKARLVTIYGGVDYDDQLKALKDGVDIVVGTAGRVLDLVNRKSLDLAQVNYVVLDEADEMLDMGFLPDVEKLLGFTNSDRQSMLFSATMPSQVVALARSHMHQPVHVRAEGHDQKITVPDTVQFVYQTHDLDKPEILGKLLQSPNVEKMMVFTHTKRSADRLATELVDRGFSASAIHGDLSQQARERALRKFRRDDLKVLVATDVAARGLDVTGVSHVVNYECPDDARTYVHRIGRTGRAGNKGVAITLVDWADLTRWRVINRELELPFGEPVESYSTTPQLLEDLEIPAGVKGRIADPAPREPRTARDSRDKDRRGVRGRHERDRSAHGRTDRHGHSDRHDHHDREAQPKTERAARPTRMRTRRGRVDGPAVVEQPVAAHSADAPVKKTRRRTRNGNPVDQ